MIKKALCLRRKRQAPVAMTDLDPLTILDIKKGKTKDVLTTLLDTNVNVKEATTGDTPLHVSIEYHANKISYQLLKVKALDVNMLNRRQQAPIHTAIRNKNYNILKALCKKRSHELVFTQIDSDGNNILHYASMKQSTPTELKSLLKEITKRKDMTSILLLQQNSNGDTPLHLACAHGADALARLFVGRDRKALEMRNKANELPLDIAFKSKKDSTASIMLMETPTSLHPKDLLNRLIIDDYPDLIRRLLCNENNDVRFAADSPKSLSSFATTAGSPAKVTNKSIQQKLVPIRRYNVPNCDGITPFHNAILLKRAAIVSVLLSQEDIGVDIETPNGDNAALLAFRHPINTEIASLIVTWLSARKQVYENPNSTTRVKQFRRYAGPIWPVLRATVLNHQNNEGETLLHFVTNISEDEGCGYHGAMLQNLQRILSLEPDVCLEDKKGNTAFHLAVKNGNIGAAVMLRLAGSPIEKPDGEGFTAVEIALARGDSELINVMSLDPEVLKKTVNK